MFVLLPGLLILGFTWYYRFSQHHYRQKRTKGTAIFRASLEIGVVVAILAFLILRR